MMVICLVTQITYLNEGVRLYDALLVVPVYQAYWIISGIVGGAEGAGSAARRY